MGVDQWEGWKGRMKPVGQQRQAPRCTTSAKGGRGRSVTVHEHPRETGGSLGKPLRSRKSISVGEPSGAGGRHDDDFRFWRFFFFSQPVKIKYHAVAKSTRKCLSLTCSVVRMLDGQVKDKSVRNLM